MKQSLGLVEVRGMTAALTVADAMCKTANVQIHKLEKTRGGGWMLVMILGDVQAVQVAVDAGASVAKNMNCYIGQTVIARLSDDLLDTVSPVIKEVVEEVLLDETVVTEASEAASSPVVELSAMSQQDEEGDDITMNNPTFDKVAEESSLRHEENATVGQVDSEKKKGKKKSKKAKRKA